MKKIFSIFIIALIALTANIFNAGAGNINFRFNIKDSAGNPVSGVSVNVNAVFFNGSGTNLGEKVVATVGPSDESGLATGKASFLNTGGGYATNWPGTGNGWNIFGPSFPLYQSVWCLSAIGPSGYSFITRDFRTSSNATMSGAAGNDERFCLTGGWLDSGATINYDVIVNTPAPVLSFDTSEIQNKSDFESRTIEKGSTIDPASIPTPVCINANKEFQYWSTDGITPFDFTQTITSNIKLIPVFKIEISFDTSTISNASDFPTYYVEKGSTITAPSTTPIHATHSDWELASWSADGSAAFDFTKPVTADVTLKPVWTNPNLKGTINFKVLVWDHNAYWAHPNEGLRKSNNYGWTVTGIHGHTVNSNYEASAYTSNAGWTNIPVSGMKFTLYTSKHVGGGRQDPKVLGTITTDMNGEASLILGSDVLNSADFKTNYVIDCDPDTDCLGSIDRNEGFGREYCVFNWDLEKMGTGSGIEFPGAGVMGSRYIKEGVRHDDSGILLGNYNDNDAMLITSNDKENGFEFTFYCYVQPAPCAQFEVNGGTMPSGTSADRYPIQKFAPINSTGQVPPPYTVKNPGDPIPPTGMRFEGWHEVRIVHDAEGYREYIDPEAFKFGGEITHSVVLRAIYGVPEIEYAVRWAPETWDGNSDDDLYEMSTTYKNGEYPSYNVALPTAKGKNFIGWDLYAKSDIGDRSFGPLGNYEYVKTILQPTSSTDVGEDYMSYIETSFGNFWLSPMAISGVDLIYVAKFETVQTITVVKEGLWSDESAIFTLSCDGQATRTIVLTGDDPNIPVSETVLVSTGNWTVTENMAWSWAYNNAAPSKQVTVNAGDAQTVTFTNTHKTTTPKYGESNAVNTFNK